MIPVEPNEHQMAHWREADGCEQHLRVIGGPQQWLDVIPCPALVAPDVNCVHVAYRLDEIEVAHLAQGGTLWLTTWGGLPTHLVSVQPPPAPAGGRCRGPHRPASSPTTPQR